MTAIETEYKILPSSVNDLEAESLSSVNVIIIVAVDYPNFGYL